LMQLLNLDNHNKYVIPFQITDSDLRWESKRWTKKPREKDGCGKSWGHMFAN
jgi:hypothetical protein